MKNLIEKAKQLWIWFNGKKTYIGTTILLVAPYISSFRDGFLINILHIPNQYLLWITPLVAALIYIGTGLCKLGLLHAGTKLMDTVSITKKADTSVPAVTVDPNAVK